MVRPKVDTAAKLLAKAQSTDSPSEAIALVERAYGLLAQAINDYDAENSGGPRRRERRRLLERRRRNRAESAAAEGQNPRTRAAADSIARYRGAATIAGATRRRGVDVSL
jgi:hypothetical protein